MSRFIICFVADWLGVSIAGSTKEYLGCLVGLGEQQRGCEIARDGFVALGKMCI